ncbi:MAG: hypothetical protein JXQ65_16790 [Candidatus Marinimicrobia bacterium]|nr:hypothetical protein [Candidatus Neomarinimicrobiota bacterium]
MSFPQNYKIADFLPDSLTTCQVRALGSLNGSTRCNEDIYHDIKDSESKFQIDPEVKYYYRKIRKMVNMNVALPFGIGFSLGVENSKQKIDENEVVRGEIKQNQSHYFLAGDFNNTKYISRNFGLVGDINFSINHRKNHLNETGKTPDSKNNRTNESSYRLYNFGINPRISYGKQYPGKYSAKAMEILDELRKEGYLERELTKAEYIEFSQLVLEKYVVYHYDSHIKKMELLQSILTYMRNNSMISKDEIRPVLITEDICSYDNLDRLIARNFGMKLFTTGVFKIQRNENFNFRKNVNKTAALIETPGDIENERTLVPLYTGFKACALYSKIMSWHFFMIWVSLVLIVQKRRLIKIK